jgi:hypothetical protein
MLPVRLCCGNCCLPFYSVADKYQEILTFSKTNIVGSEVIQKTDFSWHEPFFVISSIAGISINHSISVQGVVG